VSASDSPSQPFIAQVGRSVSIEKAAQLLGVSRRTVYNRIKDGRLVTLRTPWGSRRVLVASLLELKGIGQRDDPRMLGLAQ
jgi:excisionase family DNA binding protein